METYKEGKRWKARQWVKLPDGTRKRLKVSADRKAQAIAEWHREVERIWAQANGEQTEYIPTLQQYSKVYLSECVAIRKPRGAAETERILKSYLLEELGHLRLDEVKQQHVTRLQGRLLEGKLKPKTVNNICVVLSAVLGYAQKNQLIDKPPITFTLKVGRREVRTISQEDCAKLLAACKTSLDQAAVLLAAECGLRIGEIRALTWEVINLQQGSIRIVRSMDAKNNVTPTKTGDEREVPLSPRLREVLPSLAGIDNYIFGDHLSYYGWRERLIRIYKSVAVDVPELPWHCLRHYYCTHLGRSGVPIRVVQALAGHRQITTTQRYMHTDREAMQSAVANAFGSYLGPTK
jgi:integrase